jgi:agmatinase
MLYTSNTFVPYNHPLKEADVVFLGVPFTSTSISKPAMYGPTIVRDGLRLSEGVPNRKFCDLGDLEVVPGSFELTAERIRETIKEIREANQRAFPIFIGGDHSITLPIAETLQPKTIVQIDAHSDTYKEYLGNKYGHGTWAYHASKTAKVIQIGVVSLNDEERKFLAKSKDVQTFSFADFMKFRPKIERPVHLTIDVDVLDPSYVETGFPEGMMKLDELVQLLEKIKCDSLDIVEIADTHLPSKTGFIAAQIISKVLR